jgi:CheY-like chemotaxis protein
MKSILVLDEDVEGREVLSKMLRRKGFRVYPVEHEAAAFAASGEWSWMYRGGRGSSTDSGRPDRTR